MGELRRYIKSNNLIMRVISLLVAVTMLGSSLVYFSNEKIASVAAEEGSTKPYMEYIVQRLIDGIQDEFNILEIVPYKGQGEFRYYASDKEVEEGLEDNQAYLEQLYISAGNSKNGNTWSNADKWMEVKDKYANFKYSVKYNSTTKKFEAKGPNSFTSSVLPEYDDLISEVIRVNTVEANKITDEDIKKADLIIISTGTHDNSTIGAYRKFSGDNELAVYTKDGLTIADNGLITYNSFEKVLASTLPDEDDDGPDKPIDPVVTTGNIYFKNDDNWSNVYAYYWSSANEKMIQWPGEKMTLVEGEENVFSIEIKSDVEFIIFHNDNNSQTGTINFVGFEKAYVGGEWVNYPIIKEEPSEPESSTVEGESTSVESSTEQSTEEPTTENPTPEQPTPEQPTPEQPTPEQPTPEQSEYVYVTRDMSWNMCEKLLDYMINGKEMEMPDGTVLTNVKTPVVIDNGGLAQLNKDTNMYKMLLVYRMCGADRWNILKDNISIKDANGTKYRNTDGAVTPAINVDGKGFTATSPIAWEANKNSVIKQFFDRIAPNGQTAEGVKLSAYYETEPFMANHLTDNYWVYNGDAYFIPSKVDATAITGTKNFTDRVGKSNKIIDILRYLLGAKSSQKYSFTDKVRVLEIQPCNCFEYKSLEKIKELGRKLLRKDYDKWTDGGTNDYRKYITIDYVTPNSLNGMTVDIASEYDLVIIGDNIGSDSDANRLTQSDGKTIYNDRNLNGYIYLAFGDLLKVSTYALGYLPDEYIELRNGDSTSGLKKVNTSNQHVWTKYLYAELSKSTGTKYFVVRDMKDYYITNRSKNIKNSNGKIDNKSFYLDHKLGNTRISDNDITDITKEKLKSYVQTGNPIVVADSLYNADRTKIYPTSDMYDFVENTLCKTDAKGNRVNRNVLRKETVGTAVAFLGTKAPRINFVNGEVEYIKRTDNNGVSSYSVVKENLPIKPVSPKYIGNDTSGAGGVISTFNNRSLNYKFNITGQVGKRYLIKLLVDKNNDGVFNDVNSGVSDDKNEVYYAEEVKLNKRTITYEIKSALSENFIGMLAWKIDIIQLDDNGKETVYRVSEKGYSAIRNENKRSLKVLQIAPAAQGSGTNYLELNTGAFKTLMDNVEEIVGYDMSVDLVSVDNFIAEYNSKKYTKGQLGTANDKLNGYDMVVIGFSDSYGSKDIKNDNGALDNILDFMDAGKAVLFTHDTVSWRSTPNYKAGYLKNNVMKFLSPGSIYDTKADGNNGSQTKYGDTCFNLTINFRQRVGMDKYGVTLTKEERVAAGKEIPMYGEGCPKPSYMGANDYEVREIQGFNKWNVYRMNYCFRAKSSYADEGKNYYSLRPYADGDYYNGGNGSSSVLFTTKKIVQLNEGPITMYPYNVGENVPITETHGQYFELDMEDEDIVVWYTLDDGDTTGTSDYYNKTYKDASNNFYIYSKNNITYSGAGHKKMGTSSTELKLFVNTVIKAIAGGNSEPVISVTNGGETADSQYVVYVNSADTASTYEIDFMAADADLISYDTVGGNIDLVGEFTKAEIYWVKPTGGEKLIKSGNYKATSKSGTTVTGPLKNGIIQEILLGETNLTAEELAYIEQCVEVNGLGGNFRITVSDSKNTSDTVYIQLQVRDLFEMD